MQVNPGVPLVNAGDGRGSSRHDKINGSPTTPRRNPSSRAKFSQGRSPRCDGDIERNGHPAGVYNPGGQNTRRRVSSSSLHPGVGGGRSASPLLTPRLRQRVASSALRVRGRSAARRFINPSRTRSSKRPPLSKTTFYTWQLRFASSALAQSADRRTAPSQEYMTNSVPPKVPNAVEKPVRATNRRRLVPNPPFLSSN